MGEGDQNTEILQTSCFLYIPVVGLLASACVFVYPKLGLLQLGLSLARGAEARGAARPLHTRACARTHLTYSRSYLHPVYTEVITVKPRLAMETEKQIMRA